MVRVRTYGAAINRAGGRQKKSGRHLNHLHAREPSAQRHVPHTCDGDMRLCRRTCMDHNRSGAVRLRGWRAAARLARRIIMMMRTLTEFATINNPSEPGFDLKILKTSQNYSFTDRKPQNH